MNIAIFSTKDFHHTYYINKINKIFPISYVIYESRKILNRVDNSSPFQNEQNKYEQKYFFSEFNNELNSNIKIFDVDNINSKKTIELTDKINFDIVIVFGCRKINKKIIEKFENKIVNIHRGVARKYRGLDSEFWAIKNEDFKNIGTTIHYIDENLDTGDIIFEETAKFTKKDKIYKLRAITTDLAIKGTLLILNDLKKNNISRLKQQNYGAYYSSMSRKDKIEITKIFDDFINKL